MTNYEWIKRLSLNQIARVLTFFLMLDKKTFETLNPNQEIMFKDENRKIYFQIQEWLECEMP